MTAERDKGGNKTGNIMLEESPGTDQTHLWVIIRGMTEEPNKNGDKV